MNSPFDAVTRSSQRLRAAGVVVASTLGTVLGTTPAVSAVFGIILVPISREFAWTRVEVSSAAALLSMATAVSYPLAGWLCDRFGPRVAVIIGTVTLGLAILSLGVARPVHALFYFQFIVIGVAGSLPSAVVFGKILSQWFERRRGLWMGVVGMGNGIGVMLFPLLVTAMLGPYGWRGAFMAIGVIVLLIGVPAQLLLLRAPRQVATSLLEPHDGTPAPGLTLGEALRSGRFWLLLSAMPLCGGALMAAVHMSVPLLESRGYSVTYGAQAMACVGLAAMVGEPLIGFFLDRTDQPRRLSGVYLLGIAGLFIMLHGQGPIVFALGGILLGLAIAGEFTALSYLLSRYFGLRALGSISGIAFGAVLAINAGFTLILNAVFDTTGSYAIAIMALMPILVWNAMVPRLLGPYPFAARRVPDEAPELPPPQGNCI